MPALAPRIIYKFLTLANFTAFAVLYGGLAFARYYRVSVAFVMSSAVMITIEADVKGAGRCDVPPSR